MPLENSDPLERLLDKAGRAVQPTSPGWSTLADRLTHTPQHAARRPRRWLWLVPAPFGIAAAVALWLILAGGIHPPGNPDNGNRVQAEQLPIRVERRDVDLTILSIAETDGETLYMPQLQQAGRPAPQPGKRATGQAIVKDHRLILNLRAGDNIVRFTDVAATIDPTSVRLVSTTDPINTQVVEQNFEFDLASADALLRRYIDGQIICIFKDGKEVTGYLAAYDDSGLVLAAEPPAAAGPRKARATQSINRAELQALRLSELPAELLVKPTLVWKLRTKVAGRHDTTLTYLCGLINWQADYVVVVIPGDGQKPDRIDLTGWVTIDNRSGATYDKAGLKLIAGDVSRKTDPWAVRPQGRRQVLEEELLDFDSSVELRLGHARREFVEKSFFEYHLYTLSAASTVRDQQIKQLSLLQRKGVEAGRRYVYDPQSTGAAVAVELTAKNEKDNRLGMPLPKGRVMLEQRDSDGESALVGRVSIDHTAVKEEIKLPFGNAFDVAGEFRTIEGVQLARNHRVETNEMRIRNHKTEAIHVRAIGRLGAGGTVTQSSLPFQQHDSKSVYFEFALKANAEQVIVYTVDYQY